MIQWRASGPQRVVCGFLLLACTLAAASPALAAPQDVPAEVSERPDLITPDAALAIENGLAFLVRTQARDGSWRADAIDNGGYPTAMTALACLALMAGGNTPIEGRYADNVRRGVDYLLANSTSLGVIARLDEEQSCMHGHGFAMLCLAEAYGMEQDEQRQARIRRVLQKAIKLTGECQSLRGGWLYQPNNRSDEGSVTVTQIQGLRACRDAGIHVPKTIIDKACKYIEMSANPDGGISYSVGQSGSRPPITAAAVATLYNAGDYENPVALQALEYTKRIIEHGDHTRLTDGHEFYSLLYTSQAMYLSSEDNWEGYFPKTRDYLVKSQSKDGSWQGDHIGRAYGTAVALLALQLDYGYLPILQR